MAALVLALSLAGLVFLGAAAVQLVNQARRDLRVGDGLHGWSVLLGGGLVVATASTYFAGAIIS
jgi:uncharacterized protein YdbL (DUF1318 family)